MSQSELAYNTLREAITFGDLKPGERLVEQVVCKEYNLGRTPLREAMRRLQTEGYIDIVPNKGVTVKKLSINDVANIWSIIALMEGYAVELATQKLTKEDIAALNGYHEKMLQLTGSEDAKTWADLNVAFHCVFVNACSNDYLIKMIDELRARIYRYRFLTVFILGKQKELNNDHQILLNALSKNDAAHKVGEKMRRHVERVRDISIELLKQYGI